MGMGPMGGPLGDGHMPRGLPGGLPGGLSAGLPGGMSGGLPGGIPGMPGGLGSIDLSGGMPHQTFTLSGLGYGDSSDTILPDGASTEPTCQVLNELY